MDINLSAPVVYEERVSIEAGAEHVWNILADFENWPNWNSDIEWVRLEGPLRRGAEFVWKAGPGKISSTLKEIRKPSRIAWTGKTFGIKAVHVWEIAEDAGRSTVTTRESWDGIHVRFFKKVFKKMLAKSIHEGLEALKKEAKARFS